jgi:hypothetical protein
MRVTLVLVLLGLFTSACASPPEPPAAPPRAEPQREDDVALAPVPFEDEGACPFEGCVYRRWTATDSVDVHGERADDAPVTFTIPAGESVQAVTGVVVTTRPGRVRFRRAVDLPSESGAVHVEPEQELFLLTYQGEGFFTASVEGIVHRGVDGTTFMNGACGDEPHRCVGEIVQQPESTWWVQVRTARGESGWTDEPGKFSGKDALAGPADGAR